MSDSPNIDPESQEEIAQDVLQPDIPKRSILSRLGCGVLLMVWFTLLLAPCALFYLAANGEIRIWHQDIPEPHVHPRLLIELITEVDYRGLRIVNSSVDASISDDSMLCVQTNVSYLLWQSAEDDQNTSYCDCYIRENNDIEWQLSGTNTGVCSTDP